MSVALKSHMEALCVKAGLGDLKAGGVIEIFLLGKLPGVPLQKLNVHFSVGLIREKNLPSSGRAIASIVPGQ